ncbi:MAG: phytoene desaturase family protein [Halolamina sp.]
MSQLAADVRSTASLGEESVAVVGAGFGGLSTACYLADAGADVTVYERLPRVGGVAGRIEREGYRFDTGPTWYLMPGVFERFFGHFGRSPAEFYEVQRLDPHYRVFWKDGDRVDVPADLDGIRELFESYESGAADALDRYLEKSAESYEIGMERFVYEDRSTFRDMLDLDVVRSGRGLPLLRSMDDHVARYVDHPKLQQLLQYTLVFLGGAPHNTPAIYNLMSHVDMEKGVYYPTGGMASVVDGVAELAGDLGVDIRTDAEVDAIRPNGSDVAVSVDGEQRAADRVVAAAPPAHVERDLLPDGVSDESGWGEPTYAPSAFMLYLGVEGECPELDHHTLVLPTDWDGHFRSIFDDPGWPEDPAYYLCVPSRTDPTVAPDDGEAVVVLVPIAPGLDDGPEVRAEFREKVLSDVADHTGVNLRGRIRVEEQACVSEFADAFNAPQGTALGLAHTLFQTGPMRPGRRAPGTDRVYYAGSYSNPGIGVPMALVSGEHAAEAVHSDVR